MLCRRMACWCIKSTWSLFSRSLVGIKRGHWRIIPRNSCPSRFDVESFGRVFRIFMADAKAICFWPLIDCLPTLNTPVNEVENTCDTWKYTCLRDPSDHRRSWRPRSSFCLSYIAPALYSERQKNTRTRWTNEMNVYTFENGRTLSGPRRTIEP